MKQITRKYISPPSRSRAFKKYPNSVLHRVQTVSHFVRYALKSSSLACSALLKVSGRLPHVQSCTFALAYISKMLTYVGVKNKNCIRPFATLTTAQWEIMTAANIATVPTVSVSNSTPSKPSHNKKSASITVLNIIYMPYINIK